MDWLTLTEVLRYLADKEGGPMDAGWPDRWRDDPHWRCTSDHVSTRVLMSEALGRDACLAGNCRAQLHLTFPEDTDGPLPDPDQNVWDFLDRT